MRLQDIEERILEGYREQLEILINGLYERHRVVKLTPVALFEIIIAAENISNIARNLREKLLEKEKEEEK